MAYRVLRLCGIITNSIKHCHAPINVATVDLLKPNVSLVQNARNTSTFFTKRPAEQLWKAVTSVSNAGRRRGRAKGLGRKKDLNRGQVIGIGKVPIRFPGLNAPVFRGREIIEQCRLEPDPEREEKLIQLRNKMTGSTRIKLSPLERGWTGAKLGGVKLGPPDPIGEDTFEGFETWVLQIRTVSVMSGNLGRKKSARAFVVTGNGKGLVGFSGGKATESRAALKTARNKSGLKLMYIPRFQDRTVLHDFFSQFSKSKVFVKQMYPGYGLVCHRAIKVCCEAIGIKDMYAKVEGSKNLHNVIKAFFIGLLQQKSHEQLANEKRLHVVEFKKENGYFPTVVASPSKVRTPSEVPSDEILDLKQYVMGNRIVLEKKKYPPFYTKDKAYLLCLRKQERLRNQNIVRLRLKAEYGKIRSFLADKYPEAVNVMWCKKRVEEEKLKAQENS